MQLRKPAKHAGGKQYPDYPSKLHSEAPPHPHITHIIIIQHGDQKSKLADDQKKQGGDAHKHVA